MKKAHPTSRGGEEEAEQSGSGGGESALERGSSALTRRGVWISLRTILDRCSNQEIWDQTCAVDHNPIRCIASILTAEREVTRDMALSSVNHAHAHRRRASTCRRNQARLLWHSYYAATLEKAGVGCTHAAELFNVGSATRCAISLSLAPCSCGWGHTRCRRRYGPHADSGPRGSNAAPRRRRARRTGEVL